MKTKNKIPKTFIGFLVASVLIWLLITLSKEYVTTIRFPIQYKNIAQDKLLQATPQKELEIAVKADGFKILKTRVNTRNIAINANVLSRKADAKYYLLTKNQKISIQKQLPSGIVLQEILKDTLFLDIGTLVTKKIPLKPNLKINYHVGYDLAEDITIQPDSILVSGPENYISAIEHINLSALELEDVKADFKKKVGIKVPKDTKNLKFNLKEVTISGKVEKFTEGTFEIPYRITNIPNNVTLNTLSKTVEVTFIVGLSKFNEITKNSFQVECDYKFALANNLNYLIPKLVNKPSEIKSYKIAPNKIDFLIQK
ncbi:YbbR-like domain-containing protein [uncultured Polaribacter sp.]|uniref:YbbR-like domain-containing protein n=1 Tax=uncultured Polaribacter sp. TaxID=174711 RepID=UPI002635E72B|nr:YbbR-like domain-containing protein [uncultured Polaribacter sp.]